MRSGAPTPKKLKLLFKSPHIGQLLSEFFHWKSRSKTSTIWLSSANEIMKRRKAEPKFLNGAEGRLIRCTRRTMNPCELEYEVVRTNSSLLTLTHFRASVSKYFCDTLTPRNVLDFSAGWGDRLTGFLASTSVESITLIDPRPSSIQQCIKQHSFVSSTKAIRVYQQGAEDALKHIQDNSIDLIISSPPYFNLELYGETEEEAVNQIRNKVTSTSGYIEVFLRPVLHHCSRVLTRGGTLALNIDDNPRVNVVLCQSVLDIAEETCMCLIGTAGLRKGTGFGQGLHSKTSTKAEPIYVFKKM